MPKEPKSKRAFYVESEDYGADILFAHSANEFWRLGQYTDVIARPEFDKYVEQGWVPAEEKQKDGFYLNCDYCDKLIPPCGWDYDEDRELFPVLKGRHSFCCRQCHKSWTTETALRRQTEKAWLALLNTRCPGLKVRLTCWKDDNLEMWFDFPGGKSHLTWSSEWPEEFTILPSDLPAWEQYESMMNG